MFAYNKLIIVLNLAAVLHAQNLECPIYAAQNWQLNPQDTKADLATLCDKYNVQRPSDLVDVPAAYPAAKYYSQLDVGTPPQALKTCFDTASSDVKIRSNYCKPLDLLCLAQQATSYIYKISSTFLNLGYQLLNGKSVPICVDTLSIAGANVANQAFYAWQGIMPSNVDAIVGFAQGLTTSGHSSIIQSLLQQNKIDKNIFAFILKPSADGSQAGKLILGNSAPTANNLTYTPVIDNKFWKIALTSIAIAQTAYEATISAFVDFAYQGLIIGDKTCFDGIMREFGAQQGNDGNYYANSISSLPSLTFRIQDTDFAVSPDACFEQVGNAYMVKIQYVPNTWIMGQPLYQGRCILHDNENKRIGISQKQ